MQGAIPTFEEQELANKIANALWRKASTLSRCLERKNFVNIVNSLVVEIIVESNRDVSTSGEEPK